MSLVVEVFEEDGTLVGTQTVWAESSAVWFEDLGWFGGGQLTVPTDQASLLVGRRLVRFTPTGKTPFVWQLQQPRHQRIADTDDALLTVWRGTGALAVLGTGDWGGAVNPDTHTFGWIETDADETGAVNPTSRGVIPEHLDEDVDWPDNNNPEWVGSDFDSGDGTWMRRFIDQTAVDKTGPSRMIVTGAGPWRVWIDGEEMASGDPYAVGRFDFELTQPGHQLAFESLDGPVAFTIFGLDDDGNIDNVKYRSFEQFGPNHGSGDPDAPVAWQNGDEPPGVTWGHIMDRLLTDAQARGAIPGVSWTFDETNDSDGNAWQVNLRIWTVRGNELLGDVALSAAEAFGGVDVRMLASPLLELAAYDPLGSDLSASITLTDDGDSTDPEDVSVVTSAVVSPPAAGTAARMSTKTSAGWVEDTGLIADFGRVEIPISVGTAETLDEVENAGQTVLDKLAPLEVQDITVWDRPGATYGDDFDLGDIISVRHSRLGTYQPFKVIRGGQSVEEGGDLIVDLTVREVRT